MRAPWELRAPAGTPWIATGIRALLLAFCAVLMALGRGSGERTSWLSALLIVAVAAALLPSRPSVARVIAAGEAVLAAAAVVYTGGADSPFLAYLPAACFGAGITIGGFGLVICAGVAAGVALLARLATLTPETSVEAYTTASAEWTVIAVTLGLPGVMVRGLGWSSTSVRSQYGEVYRLLDQLRAVTRSLPGSLDPGTAAGALLDRVRRSASAQRGAVLLYSGDRFVPLAVQGARRVPWRP
jgi:hypothetical protein